MFSSSSPSYWPATNTSPSSDSSSDSLLNHLAPYSSSDNLLSPDDLPKLVSGKITSQVINYLVDRVYDAVDFGLNRPSSSSPRTSFHNKVDPERKAFTDFVATVLRRAEVTLSPVMGALVYIDRARPHLSIAIEEWALHRVFLGALIVASKYLNDASLKNAHWALCTGVFGRRDVQRIEREFLDVLAWELAVTETDLVQICSRMAREGVLICPNAKVVSPVSQAREARMEIDGAGVETRSRKVSNGSLRTVRALWDEARLRQAQVQQPNHLPEKRAQADVEMEVDSFEERSRRRRSVYPSPTSSDGSTCTASSSPASDSDETNSPCTPPPHQAPGSLGHFVPGSTAKSFAHPMHSKSASNGSMSYQPLTLLDAFPPVPRPPLPTPALALSPVQAPTAPPPLPSLPPYPSYPLHRSYPASHTYLRPHSARPASPYAKPSLSAGTGTGSHPRSMTPYTHRRSSALSSMPMVPSLYPAYIPATNA